MLFSMWWLLKYIVLGPPSVAVEAPLRRRLNAVEADIEQLQSDRSAVRGQILTLQRRVRQVENEYFDEDYNEDDEVNELLEQRRKALPGG